MTPEKSRAILTKNTLKLTINLQSLTLIVKNYKNAIQLSFA